MKRAERLAGAQEAIGNVDIETTLACGYRSWSARFRLSGPQGSYVMKGISDFVERMRTGEFFSYGKKLRVPPCAGPAHRARPSHCALPRPRRGPARADERAAYWRYRSSNVVGRDLELTDAEAVELLDLLRPVGISPWTRTRSGARRAVRTRIVDEDPRITVALRPADRGGYFVERTDFLALAAPG